MGVNISVRFQALHKMAKTFLFVFPLLFLSVYTVTSKICKEPPTAESYENVKYEPIFGNGDIEYSSRKHTPDGPFNNASGVLEAQDETRNGYFRQQLYINGIPTPKVDYRVIHIDDDSAIEYDCTENFLTHDYCIHIMSRTPTMSEEKLQNLLDYAAELDLNVDNLDYKTSDQTGCW